MVIGITGGFGCGKSTVLALFERSGAKVFSADRLCHEIYEAKDKKLLSSLKDHFGSEAVSPDGTVNRRFIASKVFSDDGEMDFLNTLLADPLREKICSVIRNASEDGITAFEIPLLFEAHYEKLLDKVITVFAPDNMREKFLANRNFNADDMKKRDAMQLPLEEKVKLADFVIINNSTEDFLEKQFTQIWNSLTR